MQFDHQKINCEFFFQNLIQLQNKDCDSNILVTFVEENDLPQLLNVNSQVFRNIIQSLVHLASEISNDRHIIVSTSYYGSVLRVELKFRFNKCEEEINNLWLNNFKQNNLRYKNLNSLISDLGSQLLFFLRDDLSGYFRFYINNNFLS